MVAKTILNINRCPGAITLTSTHRVVVSMLYNKMLLRSYRTILGQVDSTTVVVWSWSRISGDIVVEYFNTYLGNRKQYFFFFIRETRALRGSVFIFDNEQEQPGSSWLVGKGVEEGMA